jgi:hypothetical protein
MLRCTRIFLVVASVAPPAWAHEGFTRDSGVHRWLHQGGEYFLALALATACAALGLLWLRARRRRQVCGSS